MLFKKPKDNGIEFISIDGDEEAIEMFNNRVELH